MSGKYEKRVRYIHIDKVRGMDGLACSGNSTNTRPDTF